MTFSQIVIYIHGVWETNTTPYNYSSYFSQNPVYMHVVIESATECSCTRTAQWMAIQIAFSTHDPLPKTVTRKISQSSVTPFE